MDPSQESKQLVREVDGRVVLEKKKEAAALKKVALLLDQLKTASKDLSESEAELAAAKYK